MRDTFTMDVPPKDLSHHLSPMARRRKPSVLKGMYKYFLIPGMQNLAAGMPSADLFPFETLEGEFQKVPERRKGVGRGAEMWERGEGGEEQVSIKNTFTTFLSGLQNAAAAAAAATGEKDDGAGGNAAATFKRKKIAHLVVPKYPNDPNEEPPNLPSVPALASALQYGLAQGYPPLSNFLAELVMTRLHHPFPLYTSPPPGILLTCGTTDGLNKVFEMLLAPGDSLLCEEYTYLPAPTAAYSIGARVFGVEVDTYGIRADALEYLLSTWSEEERGGARKPRVIYTITVGQNPTGKTVPAWRRREVYAVCERHDVIIVEDDPYWHLQYVTRQDGDEDGRAEGDVEEGTSGGKKGGKEKTPYLQSLTQSYLTHDPSGRVIHLSTFSKTLCPGARLGWIVAQQGFIAKLVLATEGGTQQPSGFTQALVAELLSEKWGVDGFIKWMEYLRDVYREKMEAMVGVLRNGPEEDEEEVEEDGFVHIPSRKPTVVVKKDKEDFNMRDEEDEEEDNDKEQKEIPLSEMYSFNPPSAGMFIWVKVLYQNHPLYHYFPSSLPERLFEYLAVKHKVLVAPGSLFRADQLLEVLPAPGSAGGRRSWGVGSGGWGGRGGRGLQQPVVLGEGAIEADAHFRLSFSVFEKVEEVREVTGRFVRGVKMFWALKREELEAIGEEGGESEGEREEGVDAAEAVVGGKEWRAVFGC